MFKKIHNEIKKHNKIIVIRHLAPDFDAYGSQIGLALSLRKAYPEKEIYMDGDDNINNIFKVQMDELKEEDYKEALVIICDTSTKNLLLNDYYKYSDKVCIFDHHDNVPDIDGIVKIESTYSSAAELIAEFIIEENLPLGKDVADALFTGIVGDSNRFLYKGTSDKTFMITARLIKEGADLINDYKIMQKEEKEQEKRMKGFVLTNFVVDRKVAYIYIKKEDRDRIGVDAYFSSRGCINLLSNIEGIESFVGFTESDDEDVYVEMRSKSIPIVEVAKKYLGGGHLLACGTKFKKGFEYKKIIDDLNEVINNEYL